MAPLPHRASLSLLMHLKTTLFKRIRDAHDVRYATTCPPQAPRAAPRPQPLVLTRPDPPSRVLGWRECQWDAMVGTSRLTKRTAAAAPQIAVFGNNRCARGRAGGRHHSIPCAPRHSRAPWQRVGSGGGQWLPPFLLHVPWPPTHTRSGFCVAARQPLVTTPHMRPRPIKARIAWQSMPAEHAERLGPRKNRLGSLRADLTPPLRTSGARAATQKAA